MVFFAYLLGSLSSAILLCRLFNLPDPRTQGSKNPGATNVLRMGSKKLAALTLFGDMLKGIIPVLLAKELSLSEVGVGLVVFFAFFGHLYPIFFKFKGGKGVATALGCFLALSLPVGIALILTWIIVAFCFRYSSLASLTAALTAPLYVWFFTQHFTWVIIASLIGVMLISRHQQNIVNLWRGKEDKIGSQEKS